jgi:hypothetical protein
MIGEKHIVESDKLSVSVSIYINRTNWPFELVGEQLGHKFFNLKSKTACTGPANLQIGMQKPRNIFMASGYQRLFEVSKIIYNSILFISRVLSCLISHRSSQLQLSNTGKPLSILHQETRPYVSGFPLGGCNHSTHAMCNCDHSSLMERAENLRN